MKILNSFFNGYFKQKNAETGRSMVEILGVLAVIGVLSIGGIYGYTFAMDKYRANDIIYEVNLRANDVWHKYQEQPLPDPSEDGTDFDEFPDMTGTGYPIYMTSHPDVAFKTYVEGVSSRVCKNVVNMNLNGIVKGIQFVQVNGTKYTGNASICGEDETDNTIVFTSFLDSENNEAGTGQSGDPCVEDMDCTSPCGNATCDTDKMTCQNDCTGTANPHCFDNNGTGVCVECLTNKDCPNEQICDLTNHKCVDIPKTCGEGGNFGKEYRAANGSCVSCDYMSEIIIMNSDDNDGIFEKTVGDVTIADTHSGIEMCQACASIQHRIEEAGTGGEKKTYCATSCVKGNSFMNETGECVPCNSTSEPTIANTDQAKLLCAACTNRIWLNYGWRASGPYRCHLKTCPDGYYKSQYGCKKCTTTGDLPVIWGTGHRYSGEHPKDIWEDLCNKCGQAKDESLRKGRDVVQNGSQKLCVPNCQTSSSDTTKYIMNWWGECYPCDSDINPTIIYNGVSYAYLNERCLACGNREIKDNKCVKIRNSDCSGEAVPSFLGADYKCYPCTHEKGVTVDSNETSKCESACNGQRFFDSVKSMCFKKCGDRSVMAYDGTCKACSDIGDGFQMGYFSYRNTTIQNICRTACGSDVNDVYIAGTVGDYDFCAPIDCGEGKIHGRTHSNWSKICFPCPTATTQNEGPREGIKTECEACGNHVYVGKYCAYVNPGHSGICNYSPNKTKWSDYVDGIGVKYLDNTGICRDCSEPGKGYEATADECASCNGLRHIEGGYCVYGGCIQHDTFMSTTECVACNTSRVKVAIPTRGEANQLCNDCNRRVMSDVNELKYCVRKCDSDEWQDINGDCWGSAIDVGTNEIGTDELSAQLCRNASRIPHKDTETGKVYCQQ